MYKPKHAKKRTPFLQRRGQSTRLFYGFVGSLVGTLLVSPTYAGAVPMAVDHPVSACVIWVGCVVLGWLYGSHRVYRKK